MSLLETTSKRDRDTLVKALDRTVAKIQEVGWCKGNMYRTDYDGNKIAFCMAGAANEVGAPSVTINIVGEYLKTHGKRRDGCAVGYNDARRTTKRNVLDALRGTKRMIEKYTPSK